MTYNFDKVVSRFGTNSAKWDGMAQSMGSDMIALSVADMDLPAPPMVVDKVAEAARHGIYGYTDPFPPYFEAVRTWLDKAYDWQVEPDWIVFCPRIVQAVSVIIQNFTEAGDGILVHTPVYQPVAKAVTLNDRILVESPLRLVDGRYEIDFDDMERRMQEGVKMVLLISPHNPVGRVWTRDELERMAKLCIRYDALIVSDDIHADFIHEGHEHTIIAKLSEEVANRSIICTSPGKTFNLASLEIANIIIPNAALREQFKHGLLQAGIHNPTFFSVPALEVAYTSCDEWLTELRAYIKDNIAYARTFITDHMPELAVIEPEGTYLLWIDCTAVSSHEKDLVEWIQEKARVSVSFGSSFGPGGEGYIRVNVAAPRPVLQEGLKRLAAAYPLHR
ncbi:pyridoxal phosphate-dependent aminotransferase [Virgibacillus sp. LDC1]|uniref:MalY/PatB family protein n=1 Tax=Paenibacillus sp. GM2FR TaxID=2059268 RepID=UPI000C27E828|nr:MalY/PatB family protein [Paenibacillus sp. GM2FR]MCV4234637.1 pyridoxal phosphate-dependent aminotransferase [Virgibacillus sp. LDC1]PJN50332.1 Cystathionine beta-lyase PatB [Paenibacillus sp. GM2FR]